MENLIAKISKMVQDSGLVKFEDCTITGKAARLAAYQGIIKEYARTPGHTVYTVKVG